MACASWPQVKPHNLYTRVRKLRDSQNHLLAGLAGLGWQRVVGVMLLLQLERFKDPTEHGPVLVLGCADWQRQVLKDELVRLQRALRQLQPDADEPLADDAAEPMTDVPVDVTNEMPSAQRTELYQTKANLFVTTRILVVDLLTGVVQPKQIAGLVIMNVHRVQDTGGEGFACRLFRASNQQVGAVLSLS